MAHRRVKDAVDLEATKEVTAVANRLGFELFVLDRDRAFLSKGFADSSLVRILLEQGFVVDLVGIDQEQLVVRPLPSLGCGQGVRVSCDCTASAQSRARDLGPLNLSIVFESGWVWPVRIAHAATAWGRG